MKNKCIIIGLLLVSVIGFLGCGTDEKKGTDSSQQIIIGLDDNFPPMGFRNVSNEIVGFDIDMAKEAAKRMGKTPQFKPIDWSAKEVELNAKRIDLLWNGLTITEERKKNIAFSDPYIENFQIIIVASTSSIKKKEALKGKVVGVQAGSSAINAIEADPGVLENMKELKQYGDNVTALFDLELGRIDALVVDEVVGRYYVAKAPNTYFILDENFGTEEFGVGVHKENTELLTELKKVLAQMKADGTSAKIATKWFGKDIIK